MNKLIRKIFFKGDKITTFLISRLHDNEIKESVYLKAGNELVEITKHHGMICLDPFCIAVWLPIDKIAIIQNSKIQVQFKKDGKIKAIIHVSFMEQIATGNGSLILFKVGRVSSFQLNPIHQLVLFNYLLKSPKNTYTSRKVISALYSYPRSIIIVSYQDKHYQNIFPMDIHSYIEQEGLYILGLRTTNVTLNKILEQKKVVVCDTDSADINVVYNLGKHPSASPTPIEKLPFGVNKSELFGFPVPDFCGSYKEIEVIHHQLMGYHMLILGKVVHFKKINPDPASFYHVGFLAFQNSGYNKVEAVY